jgi:hypothetical protein
LGNVCNSVVLHVIVLIIILLVVFNVKLLGEDL